MEENWEKDIVVQDDPESCAGTWSCVTVGNQNDWKRDFPAGPMAKTALTKQGAQVWS